MKCISAIASMLVLVATSSFAGPGIERHFGSVIVTRGADDVGLPEFTNAGMNIRKWNSRSLPTDVDSALQFIHDVDVVTLFVDSCDGADSSVVCEVAGRFTPWPVTGISPAGPVQWDRPLIILLPDSSQCYPIVHLAERRWTKVVVLNNRHNVADRQDARDMVRRYKRERVDRLEDMFRK